MTDLEMTRLRAEAMGLDWPEEIKKRENLEGKWRDGYVRPYDPLTDDAQAMALVKRFAIGLDGPRLGDNDNQWSAVIYDLKANDGGWGGDNADLNRAIVECVARMQAAKEGQ